MAKDTSLTFSLYGKDVSATSALKNVGNAAKDTGGAFGRIKEIAAGVFSAHLIEKAGAEIMKFGKESLTAFVDVGKEVSKTQRITGGSVEEASKLRFAFMESGLEIDKAQMSLKKFAQSVDGNSKAFKTLHINVKDAHGNQKTFNELLLETADKFQKMPNGIHKSAMAVNLFGRTGLDMLKFLNKGKEGLIELENEAQKYGLVLTKDNMAAVAASVKAHKELHAAVQGLQVQVGAHLTPIMTKAVTAFTTIFPILLRYVNPAFKALGEYIKPIVAIFMDAQKYVLSMGERFITTGGHLGRFKEMGKSVVSFLGTLRESIKAVLESLKPLWQFIVQYIAPVLVFGLEYGFKAIALAAKLVPPVIRVIAWVLKELIVVVKGVGSIFADIFKGIVGGVKMYVNSIISAVNLVISALNAIHFKFPTWIPKLGGKEFGLHIPKIPALAEGGIVDRPTLALIGEAGPEAVVPLNKGAHGGINVTIHVGGSVIAEKDLVLKVRNEIAQLMRRNGATTLTLGI